MPKNDQQIRVTVCARRNPKLSEDEFNEHWANKHGPLIRSWLQKHNCIKYIQVRSHKGHPTTLISASLFWIQLNPTQYHTTSVYRSRLTQSTLPYDGIADFWYKSFDDFESAYADEFYTNIVKKDEEYLFDMESLAVTAGVEQVVIEDRKVVDGPGQKT